MQCRLRYRGRLWRGPDTFDPARFLPEAPPPPRFSYMPFGDGPRICIGAQFALTELVLAIATLVRASGFELADPTPANPTGLTTIRAEKPLHFLVRERGRQTGVTMGRSGSRCCPFKL